MLAEAEHFGVRGVRLSDLEGQGLGLVCSLVGLVGCMKDGRDSNGMHTTGTCYVEVGTGQGIPCF